MPTQDSSANAFRFVPQEEGRVAIYAGTAAEPLGFVTKRGRQWAVSDGRLFKTRQDAAAALFTEKNPKPKSSRRSKAEAKPVEAQVACDEVKPEVPAPEPCESVETVIEPLILEVEPETVSSEDDGLPVAFGENRIVAMARDPESAFVYWELTADAVTRSLASLEHPDAALTLRIYLLPEHATDTGEASEVRDYAVQDWIGRFQVAVNRPGARMVAAVGFKSDETFVHIARAAAVRLPGGTSAEGPVRFRRVLEIDEETNVPLPRAEVETESRPGESSGFAADATACADRPAVHSQALRAFQLGHVLSGAPADLLELARIQGSAHLADHKEPEKCLR